MNPRDYQLAAMDAVDDYLATRDGNPCVVLPTGGGKTPTMAWLNQRWLTSWPTTRILVLAHVPELLEQGIDKLREVWPAAPAGVYSAKLKSRNMMAAITYAGIQSIHDKAFDFEPWDVIHVDEAHRIPLSGEGTYRRFLGDCRKMRPHVRVVGWTATAYRLAGGPICHRDHILNEICFDVGVRDLIDQGHLCRLRSKAAANTASVAGVAVRSGEFVTSQLSAAVDTADRVQAAIAEAVQLIGDRRCVLFFCVTKDHAAHVSAELARHGMIAPVICDGTPAAERRSILEAFKAGKLRAVCNVNILTEGFDARRVDCVVMLRPTASLGLYYQTVGRGLRLHEDKADCLVLDFAGNVERHGPIDALDGGPVQVQKCGDCLELYSRAFPECPACGWYKTVECERCGNAERASEVACSGCGYLLKYKTCPNPSCGERSVPTATICEFCDKPFPVAESERAVDHRTKASGASILSDDETPWEVEVTSVSIKRHERVGKPPTLQVTYYGSGLTDYHREWVCLEHDGFAGAKAKQWWRRRFGDPVPMTVDGAIGTDLFLDGRIASMTQSIKVRRKNKKYTEVIDATLAPRRPGGAIAG